MENFNIFCILQLLGGLAFFLYGMHIMSDSLEKIAGGKLPVEFDYMILNLFRDLNRTVEHCAKTSKLFLAE